MHCKKYTLAVLLTAAVYIIHTTPAIAQTSAQPSATRSANLLPNGDFMATDPQLRPLRWTMGKALQTATITGEQRHGTNRDDKSLKLSDSSSSAELSLRSEKIIANPGTVYTATWFTKTIQGTPAILSLEFWDQNNARIGVATSTAFPDTAWHEQSVSLQAPDKCTHVTVSISSARNDTGISYCDDISLTYELTYNAAIQPGVRELFLDDYRVASMTDVQRIVHPGIKSKPLVQATEPWEGTSAYIYGTVLRNQPSGTGYRMWYTSYLDEKYYLCYATSTDGLTWKKPRLGIVDFKGSKENNICKPGGGTLVYDTADKDPSRRYKLMDMVPADAVKKRPFGYGVFFSADGLHWTPYENNPVITYGDVSTVARDEAKGIFIASTKQRMLVSNTSVTPGKMDRAAFISTSTDFIHWTAPGAPGSPWTLAVEGDHRDDLAVMSRGGIEGQIYGMTVHPYEGIYIGLPWAFDITSYTTGIFAGYGDGPIQPQIAASRDLRHWSRPNREPVLPLGKAGAWDDGTIYTSNRMQVADDSITLYYGAMNMAHGGSSATQTQFARIAKATWRRDGFMSLSNGGDDAGDIITQPIVFTGNRLTVNASLAAGGTLRVEILDDAGAPVSGFTMAEAKAITGDHLSATVSWRKGNSVGELAGRKVKLRFRLKGGDLYSYWFTK